MKKETIIKELAKKDLILVENQVLLDTVKKRYSVKKKKKIVGGLYPGQIETIIVARRLTLEEIVKKFKLKEQPEEQPIELEDVPSKEQLEFEEQPGEKPEDPDLK